MHAAETQRRCNAKAPNGSKAGKPCALAPAAPQSLGLKKHGLFVRVHRSPVVADEDQRLVGLAADHELAVMQLQLVQHLVPVGVGDEVAVVLGAQDPGNPSLPRDLVASDVDEGPLHFTRLQRALPHPEAVEGHDVLGLRGLRAGLGAARGGRAAGEAADPEPAGRDEVRPGAHQQRHLQRRPRGRAHVADADGPRGRRVDTLQRAHGRGHRHGQHVGAAQGGAQVLHCHAHGGLHRGPHGHGAGRELHLHVPGLHAPACGRGHGAPHLVPEGLREPGVRRELGVVHVLHRHQDDNVRGEVYGRGRGRARARARGHGRC
mmetsp:Transcript_50585/g.156570  ORF Transcript_50585/g.156570 Transcript_50585/m.156570 type:complete len:319 (+) Transcript_50585:45-1001(+)